MKNSRELLKNVKKGDIIIHTWSMSIDTPFSRNETSYEQIDKYKVIEFISFEDLDREWSDIQNNKYPFKCKIKVIDESKEEIIKIFLECDDIKIENPV